MHIQFFSYLAKPNDKPYSRLECPCSNVLSCSVLHELSLIPSGDWQPTSGISNYSVVGR